MVSRSSLPTAPHIGPLDRRQLPPSLRHEHHLLGKDLYQVVLHRPVELAGLTGNWLFIVTRREKSPTLLA
jgi:hypothetical protein